MVGEIGGAEEEKAAAYIGEHMKTPVVAYIAGFTAPPGKTMGHAGAIISGSAGTAQAKKEALEAQGVRVGTNPTEVAALVADAVGSVAQPALGSRRMPVAAAEHEHRVTPRELFFDLVFVFAFTQVATLLADEPTFAGIGRGVLVLAALWWAWASYAWLTNIVDPEESAVGAALLVALIAIFIAALARAGRVRGRGCALRRRLPRRLRDAHDALRARGPRRP